MHEKEKKEEEERKKEEEEMKTSKQDSLKRDTCIPCDLAIWFLAGYIGHQEPGACRAGLFVLAPNWKPPSVHQQEKGQGNQE